MRNFRFEFNNMYNSAFYVIWERHHGMLSFFIKQRYRKLKERMPQDISQNWYTCVRRCWPFCFIPLLMSRGKSIRTLCPRCGYDYGVRADEMVCSPKCASSRGGQSDSATSQTPRLWTECSGSRMQLGYWDRQVSGRCTNYIRR